MKKLIASIAVVAMVLTMSLSALALPSPTVSGFVKGVSSAVDKNGESVVKNEESVVKNEESVAKNEESAAIIVQTIPAAKPQLTTAEKQAVEEIKNVQKLREVMGSLWKEGMQLADIRDVKIKGDATFPVTIGFDVPGVTTKSDVVVLHFKTSDGEWEIVDSKAGNATIQATFNSLSPVAFVVDTNTANAMDANNPSNTSGSTNNGSGTSDKTSPKTGQSDFPIYAGIAAAVALGGAVLWIYRKGNTLSE